MKKGSGDIPAGTRFATNLDGELEVIEYDTSKHVRIKFLNTGNEYNVQAVNIRNGDIADRLERERKAEEKRTEDGNKAEAYWNKIKAFKDARDAARRAREDVRLGKKLLKRNRLVGQKYKDNLDMEFTVIAPAEGSSTWIIRYRESGNVYTVMEGWMRKGGVYDHDRKGTADKLEEYRKRKSVEWYEKNRGKVIAQAAEYQRKNKDKTNIRNANRRARRINAEGSHTLEETLELLNNQEFQCACCKESLEEERHLDHIMPLALGGTNWIENLQWLCPFCNLSKNDRHPDVWKAYSESTEFKERREARKILDIEKNSVLQSPHRQTKEK